MYAVRLTTEEFGPFIEKLDGDRKIEAYAIDIVEKEAEIPPQLADVMDAPKIRVTYHSLVIS